jgi:hypothetical protein
MSEPESMPDVADMVWQLVSERPVTIEAVAHVLTGGEPLDWGDRRTLSAIEALGELWDSGQALHVRMRGQPDVLTMTVDDAEWLLTVEIPRALAVARERRELSGFTEAVNQAYARLAQREQS